MSTSATAWSDAKGGEFMNKEKFDSMVPKDGLGDLDVDVPVIEAGKKNYSPRVTELATQILELNLLEIADLCDILKVGHRCCCCCWWWWWCHSCGRWASVLCPDPLTPDPPRRDGACCKPGPLGHERRRHVLPHA